jgi:glycine/D-amino acid oxidase-like deaminating enzyme
MAPQVTVIGAGVIGSACAYYLSQSGGLVTLVDQGDVGSGTSSRCDGNVLAIDKEPGYDSLMALTSQRLLHDLAGVLPPFEYRRPGSYLVCDNDDEAMAAWSWVEQQKEAGLPFWYLDEDAIHSHLPHLAPDVPAGLYCGSDSTLNPLLYTQRLVQAAQGSGCQVRVHQTVTEIVVNGGMVRGVRLDNEDVIAADVVVVAAGVWSPRLLRPLDVRLPIQPRKGHLLVSAKGPLFGDAKVMEFGYLMSKFGRERRAPQEALRYGVALVYEPTESHNFLLGSSRELGVWDTEPQWDVIQAIARRAMRFYPGMQQATLIRSYAGLRPWTPDHLPVVSRVSEIQGLVVAAGHEGDGIGLASVTGHLVCDLVLQRPPIIDPQPLRWDRPSLQSWQNGGEDG